MFLTQEELTTLTGYALGAWQRRWLDTHQWKYESAANGRVVVSRAYAESRLSGLPAANDSRVTMNIEAIRRKA